MNKSDILNYIDKKLEKIEVELDKKYKKEEIIKENFRNKNLEALLYNYPTYKAKIKIIELEIDKLKNDEVQLLHKTKNDDIKVQTSHIFKDNFEIIQDRIDSLNLVLNELKYITSKIDIALNVVKIKNELGYKIIELKYFNNYNLNQILENLELKKNRYSDIKDKAIKELKSILFL